MEKRNLYSKIQAVSIEIGNIEKNMTVGKGAYQYKAVSDLDVTLSVKTAEEKHKLVSIPIKQELLSSEVIRVQKQDGESLVYVDNIKMTVRIIDLEDTNSFIDIESFGKGIDSGDKGFGKASTYARKYALLNAYKIATGEDPDSEKSKELKTPKTISEKRIVVSNYYNKNLELLQQLIKHFNVGSMEDLSEAQVTQIYNSLSAKKAL